MTSAEGDICPAGARGIADLCGCQHGIAKRDLSRPQLTLAEAPGMDLDRTSRSPSRVIGYERPTPALASD